MNFYPKTSGFIRLQIIYNILSHNREFGHIFIIFFTSFCFTHAMEKSNICCWLLYKNSLTCLWKCGKSIVFGEKCLTVRCKNFLQIEILSIWLI